jgi:hypothetical protein
MRDFMAFGHARRLAILCTGFALLSGAPSAMAAAGCPNARLIEFTSNGYIAGWTLQFDHSQECAFPSIVALLDFTESDNVTHHKLSFTLQLDAKTGQLTKSLGIDASHIYPQPGFTDNTRWVGVFFEPMFPNITKVNMFAAFAGQECKYNGPTFTGVKDLYSGMEPKAVIYSCIKKKRPKGPHPK